jgi:hypothetical protein
MDANECGTPRCARCEVQDGTQFILRENGMRLMGSTAFFPQNSSIQDILFLQFFFCFCEAWHWYMLRAGSTIQMSMGKTGWLVLSWRPNQCAQTILLS